MKHLRIRGADLWLMTCVRNEDDLFDAFNSGPDAVISPFHFSDSDKALAEILELSDSFIPAVYVNKGAGVARRRKQDVHEILNKLYDLGFYRMCVLDTDMSLAAGSWERIADRFPSCIPFPGCPGGDIDGYGFESRVVPVRFRTSRR